MRGVLLIGVVAPATTVQEPQTMDELMHKESDAMNTDTHAGSHICKISLDVPAAFRFPPFRYS